MDLFLRVEVPPQESWCQKGQGSSPPVILEKEAGYDTDHVIKHWNPGVWTDSGQAEGNVDYMNMETEFWSKSYTDENGKSYRYYKQVLPAGKTTDCIQMGRKTYRMKSGFVSATVATAFSTRGMKSK